MRRSGDGTTGRLNDFYHCEGERVRVRIMKVIEQRRNEAILILGFHPRFKVNIVVKFKKANEIRLTRTCISQKTRQPDTPSPLRKVVESLSRKSRKSR